MRKTQIWKASQFHFIKSPPNLMLIMCGNLGWNWNLLLEQTLYSILSFKVGNRASRSLSFLTCILKFLFNLTMIQKQSSRGVLKERCSENMQQIYRRTICWSAISIKLHCNFIEIRLWHGCSPVNLLYIFRTPFPWQRW